MFYDIEANFIFVQIFRKRMILMKRISYKIQSSNKL
jgi:hypothetical protein